MEIGETKEVEAEKGGRVENGHENLKGGCGCEFRDMVALGICTCSLH